MSQETVWKNIEWPQGLPGLLEKFGIFLKNYGNLRFEYGFGPVAFRNHHMHPHKAFERLGDVPVCRILTDVD